MIYWNTKLKVVNNISSFSIFEVVPGLNTRFGGPSRSIVQLSDHLSNSSDTQFSLISQSQIGDIINRPINPRLSFLNVESNSKLFLSLGIPLLLELKKKANFSTPDIIHTHGLWHPANHWAAYIAKKKNIPLVIHPRGMLEPWSLSHHALRKKIAMKAYQEGDLKNAKVFIATSNLEYENLRNLGLRQPVAIIPNGVDFPLIGSDQDSHIHENKVRTVLFLSRLHSKKGVIELVKSWKALSRNGWRLLIAGPDDGGHIHELQALIKKLDLENEVELCGEVEGEQKDLLFRNADIFVLPTFSENFGIVVAEALSYGIPVITTKGTPWEDLERYQCGWWIELSVLSLTETLQIAMQLTDKERRDMGQRGRDYVRRYNWVEIAEQTIQVYKWILGVESMPKTLKLD